MSLPIFEFRADDFTSEDNDLWHLFDNDVPPMYDMDTQAGGPTIHGDLEKLGNEDMIFSGYDTEEDMKPEIRNGDCMWSSMANCISSGNMMVNGSGSGSGTGSNSAASSYSESSAIALAVVSGSTNPYSSIYQRSQTTDSSSSSQSNPQQPMAIKKEPMDQQDYMASQKRRRLSGGDKKSQQQQQHIQDEDMLIPPGGSLLRKRNNIGTNSSQALGDSMKYLRPDTPHSLTDEVAAPEFRHNVDLRACVIGSNNISLTIDDGDDSYIQQISRDLQNVGKDKLSIQFPTPALIDVLDLVSHMTTNSSSGSSSSNSNNSNNSNNNPQQTNQQIDEQQQAIDIATGCSTVGSPPSTGSDSDSDDGESHNFGLRHHRSSLSSATNAANKTSSSSSSSNGMLHMMHISDHSYTRCNDMVDDGPNLETPSDSDEEIDVVSYTDKKLPTNPSCHVMGALQTKMAHKISIDHMKQKTRYNNFNLPYTPASSSPVKSVANSRYPSPSSTPYQSCSSASPSYSPLSVDSSSSSSSSQSSFTTSSNKRKRTCLKAPGGVFTSSGSAGGSVVMPNGIMMGKKCRGKKVVVSPSATSSGSISPLSAGSKDMDPMDRAWQRRTGGTTTGLSSGTGSGSSVLRKDFVLGLDEADTIEKRNQHNDMERQRRIGLKNLFEALKKQIPTIRDKERAPKVNILREAAKLCTQLTQEEQELSMQRQVLSMKLKQQQEILARYRMVKSEPHSVSG
ncbi:myc protein [Drosophila biarmipes]|uniref:myc protein n=1 Tax=Drosophila biarmipes TaxID=125945 RepID=UPI0007E5FFE0|nr:myc protein [Drosophila biarmipes]XP_050741238.1 myc protein [Drosophila biarmipes]